MLMTTEHLWIKVRFTFELPPLSFLSVTSTGCATVWCALCGWSSRERDWFTVFGLVFSSWCVYGLESGVVSGFGVVETPFVFEDDQGRILCSFSVECVARALTVFGERGGGVGREMTYFLGGGCQSFSRVL